MGLDMYLYRAPKLDGLTDEQYEELYFFVQNQKDTEEAMAVLSKSALPGAKEVIPFVKEVGEWFKYLSIFTEVGYWRKVNQVHAWFVRNVQDGVDECQYARVSKDKLVELLDITKSVLQGGITAGEEKLPTQGGFFFGSTDYDEYYLGDLKQTAEILEKVLAETDFENQVIFYHSSW